MAMPAKPLQLYFSYSYKDTKLARQLERHLRALERMGELATWYDRKVKAGADWEKEIREQLTTADIILLLISPDFLASKYCYGIEVMRAMERHSAGEAIVIPGILRACDWWTTPFSKLQALPRDGKPVASWPNM